MDDGPVEPLQPPITLEQITKYLPVSNALPGPMYASHHPGYSSPAEWTPAACAVPERAWSMSIALVASALSVP